MAETPASAVSQIVQFVHARSLKTGLTHTCGRGVTHTYGTGVTHTCFGVFFGWSICTIRLQLNQS